MTIRELVISLGFQIDKSAEKRVNDGIDGLKGMAADALGALDVAFGVDRASEKGAKDSIRAIADAARPLAGSEVGFEVNRRKEQEARSAIAGMRSFAMKMLGAIGIGFSLVALNRLSEEFGGINDRIRDATRGMGDQNEIQQRILRAANESRQSYGAMAATVNRLAQGGAFDGIEEAATFATLLAQCFAAAGKSQYQASYLTRQISMDLQKGTLGARTLSIALRDAPHIANRMAHSLGVSVEGLKDMARRGEVSAEVLKSSFLESADDIAARFAETDMTVSDALANVRNGWGLFVAEMDDAIGISRIASRAIVAGFNQVLRALRRLQEAFMQVADRMGGLRSMMRFLAIAAAGIFVALNAGKILKFLAAVGKFLLSFKLSKLFLFAAIILLALLVEDFIAFMRGEDSLLGKALERLGIDADAAREAVKGLWERFKEFLPTLARWGVRLFLAIRAVKLLVGAVKLLAGAFAVLKGVKKVLTGVVWALNIAKKANPIILIVMLVVALIAAFVALWRNNEAFRDFFVNLWEGIKGFFGGIVDFVRDAIGAAVDFAREKFAAFLDFLENGSGFLADTLRAVVSYVTGIVESVVQIFRGIIDFIAGVFTGDWERAWQGIRDIFSGVVGGLFAIIKLPLNLIIAGLNLFIRGLNKLRIPDWVPGVGGRGINIPEIPKLAKGSDFSPDTFIAGEEGPELVTNAKGSKVFTAAETADVLGRLNAMADWEAPAWAKQKGGGLMDIAKAMSQTAAGAARACGAHIENRHVTQHNEFYSEFHGDRAGQERSAEAMDRASEDAAGTLARALAYC